jgi:hypothetical protein
MTNSNKKSKEHISMEKEQYLDQYVFYDLTIVNDGFDSETIKYFDKHDFEIVLDRIEKHRLGIYGIEAWQNGEYDGVKVFEDYNCKPTDPRWYRKAFEKFVALGEELQFSATYYVPDNLIKNK